MKHGAIINQKYQVSWKIYRLFLKLETDNITPGPGIVLLYKPL